MQRTRNLDLYFAGQITFLDLNEEEQAYINANTEDGESHVDEDDVEEEEDFDPDDRFGDDGYHSEMSHSQQCWQDRSDLANEIVRNGGCPIQAAEIRAGA